MAVEHAIRPAQRPDIPAIKSVVEDAELFPPEMLDDMIAGYLEETTRDIWFVAVADGQVVGFGYCEPERMTSGTWNLLAIGILAGYRGRGIGGAMMRYLETRLRTGDGRVLIVETMGTPAYARTRAFYAANGYTVGGTGTIKGDGHLIYAPGTTPMTNLRFTMLQKLGLPVERFSYRPGMLNEPSEPGIANATRR